ncbi:MAG: hypothetical protein ACI31G_00060 [Bacilli bacterium]
MKITKVKVITYLFYVVLTIAFIGSVTSSLAWFSSFSYARIRDYKGTAVDLNNRSLQVGLISEVELENYQQYNLIKEGNYYWSKIDLNEETLSYYLQKNGYAYNSLSPITSGEYITGNDLTLKESPVELLDYSSQKEASKNTYIKLDLLFRAKINGQDSYLTNENIYLSKTNISNLSNDTKGIRIFIDGNEKFLASPCHELYSLTNDYDYYLPMGGILDLNLDGYYDYIDDKEFVYGEVEGEIHYRENIYSENRKDNPTTFVSSHKPDSLIVDLNQTIFKRSEFISINRLIDNKIPLTTTNEDGIAKLSLTIYLEGWSKDIIDTMINEYFSMQLQFALYGEY